MRWQSWLVLAAVVPWCAIAALRYATAAWNGATQTALGISLALALLVLLARAATPLAAVTGGVLTAVLTLLLLPDVPLVPLRAASLAGAFSAHLLGDPIR